MGEVRGDVPVVSRVGGSGVGSSVGWGGGGCCRTGARGLARGWGSWVGGGMVGLVAEMNMVVGVVVAADTAAAAAAVVAAAAGLLGMVAADDSYCPAGAAAEGSSENLDNTLVRP